MKWSMPAKPYYTIRDGWKELAHVFLFCDCALCNQFSGTREQGTFERDTESSAVWESSHILTRNVFALLTIKARYCYLCHVYVQVTSFLLTKTTFSRLEPNQVYTLLEFLRCRKRIYFIFYLDGL